MPAVLCFREGFSFVFPVSDMRLLTPYEIDLLLNGSDESWDIESAQILFLLHVLLTVSCALQCSRRRSSPTMDSRLIGTHLYLIFAGF